MPQRGWKPADTTVQASAHTGNLSPTVEQQISSTGRVAAALIEVSQFPASTNFRWQLLYTTKEVLKPKVSRLPLLVYKSFILKLAEAENRRISTIAAAALKS